MFKTIAPRCLLSVLPVCVCVCVCVCVLPMSGDEFVDSLAFSWSVCLVTSTVSV